VRREANHMQQIGKDILDGQKQAVSDVVEAGKSAIKGS
jgi:hypothetical protein